MGTAKEQHEKLELMHNNMEEQYSELGRFYVFDPRKMSVEEFFGDLKTFKTMFEVCVCPHIIPQHCCVLQSERIDLDWSITSIISQRLTTSALCFEFFIIMLIIKLFIK